MNAGRFARAYAIVAASFLALDASWLTLTADPLYRAALGPLLRPQFDAVAAALFYLIYFAGIVVFAVEPARRQAHARDAPVRGALLGLVAYATYDLTNQATLRGWPGTLTLADLCWGSFATAVAATAARRAIRRLAPD